MDSFISLFDPGTSDESSSASSIRNFKHGKNTGGNQNHKLRGSKKLSTTMSTNINMNINNNDEDVEVDLPMIPMMQNLPPEPQLGNIEYKLKLINPSRQRFEHLVTQVSHITETCPLANIKWSVLFL